MTTLPRDNFCRDIVETLHLCIAEARPDSPIRLALDGLGESFVRVACQAAYVRAKPELQLLPHIAADPRLVRARIVSIVNKALLDLIRAWENRRYYLDGEYVGDLESFLLVNDFSEGERRAIRELRVGDRLILAGGSWATVVLECKEGRHAA